MLRLLGAFSNREGIILTGSPTTLCLLFIILEDNLLVLSGTRLDEHIKSLLSCENPQEVLLTLSGIRKFLDKATRETRMSVYKIPLERAFEKLLRHSKLWKAILFKDFAQISLYYFDSSFFRCLPHHLFVEIFAFLSMVDISHCSSVSSEWKTVLQSNDVWFPLYNKKFMLTNPSSRPIRSQRLNVPQEYYNKEYYHRLVDPQIGDSVEVAWKGKFRLETQEIYQGLAWWAAVIVDKDLRSPHQKYKIHYPGWDSRWDEWVARSRLRWVAGSDDHEVLHAGDVVELWCSGHNVPGAWLECVVKQVRNESYCLGKVIWNGVLWVDDRKRLRLVSRRGILQNGRGTGRLALEYHNDYESTTIRRLRPRSFSADALENGFHHIFVDIPVLLLRNGIKRSRNVIHSGFHPFRCGNIHATINDGVELPAITEETNQMDEGAVVET